MMGKGTFGEVFKAEVLQETRGVDVAVGDTVAIKRLLVEDRYSTVPDALGA